jgi:toxin YoeB
MEIELFGDAVDDIKYWQKSGNKIIQKKINQLFIDIQAHPFEGIGKPEALKYNLSEKWSRRITLEHRLIYEVIENTIRVYSLRGHYM